MNQFREKVFRKAERFAGRFFAASSYCEEGGLCMTFDDAFVDEWYSIKDLLNVYNAKVTFFVSNFDLLNEGQIDKLRSLRDDGHEVACHGLRHLNAVQFVQDSSIEKYLEVEILPNIHLMKCSGFEPSSFSYPYGARTLQTDDVLLNHFKNIRSTMFASGSAGIAGLNDIYYKCRNEKLIYGGGIDNIYSNSTDDIYAGMRRAGKKKEKMILYAHKITNEPGDYNIPASKLETILGYAVEKGLGFYRVSDLNGDSGK